MNEDIEREIENSREESYFTPPTPASLPRAEDEGWSHKMASQILGGIRFFEPSKERLDEVAKKLVAHVQSAVAHERSEKEKLALAGVGLLKSFDALSSRATLAESALAAAKEDNARYMSEIEQLMTLRESLIKERNEALAWAEADNLKNAEIACGHYMMDLAATKKALADALINARMALLCLENCEDAVLHNNARRIPNFNRDHEVRSQHSAARVALDHAIALLAQSPAPKPEDGREGVK